jgi:hypothetical protein
MQVRNSKSQREQIYSLLKERAGQWVPAYELARLALQYGTRVFELRQAGAVISNKTEHHRGQILSWFRLELPPTLTRPSASDPEPAPLFPKLIGSHRDNG